jgi:hypothetical protein
MSESKADVDPFKINRRMRTGIYLIALVMLLGCKKYSEDRFISLKKPESRLTGHSSSDLQSQNWKLVSYKINGAENINLFQPPASATGNAHYPPVVTFMKDKTEQSYSCGPYGSGRWYLNKSEKKSILHIRLESGGSWGQNIFFQDLYTGQASYPTLATWLIKQMYGKKMHLVQYSNNTTYELEFEKE